MQQGKMSTKDLTIFSMLSGIMYLSKVFMEWIPNVHLIGVFIIVNTIVYKKRALIPLYVYVFILGATNGFSPWWIPNLYIWFILWGMAMMVPKNLTKSVKIGVYMSVCGLHGLFYGCMYAPFQAWMFGLSWDGMIAWIIAGLPFDITHGISNFLVGIIIIPLAQILEKLANDSQNI